MILRWSFQRILFYKELNLSIIKQSESPISPGGIDLLIYSNDYCKQQFLDSECLWYGVLWHIINKEYIDMEQNTVLKNKIKIKKTF